MNKKILNRVGKKNSKTAGNQFESFVEIQCRSDRFEGKSDLFKEADSHNYRKKLHVDFIGWTRVFDGRIIKNSENEVSVLPVGVECKTIASDLFEFKLIKDHQITYLKRLSFVGGIALLLIEFRKHDKIARIQITKDNILNPKKNTFLHYYNNQKSISYKNICDLQNVKLFPSGIIPFDFLGGGIHDFLDIIRNNLLKIT